jgi:formyltetrahydrofolate-dependent phosphoribosylglycinamide formyltransferase
MNQKINFAVFASTKGTDLQAIIDAIKSGSLVGVNLKFVLSNKADCYALERSKQAGIKTIFIDPKGKSREEFDQECLSVCKEYQINLIVLIGYMRIITPVLIDAYQNRIMNIHPSLLPKDPGMDLDVHREVLKNKEKETGCTLHWVTKDLDAGPIIFQEKVKIAIGETPESLKEKVQAKEKEVIIQGIEMFRDGLIS